MPTADALARLIGEAIQSWTEQKGAPAPSPVHLTPAALAALIDHTLLKPDATEAQVRQLCQEARRYHFASVCVNAGWVPRCAELLAGSEVKVCTVAGFPLGATLAEVKAFEAATAIRTGAQEVDMVLAIGRLKGGDYAVVYADIEAVASAAHEVGALLKVILETSLLSDDEKVAGSLLAKTAGADFVKTSTGFGGGGATVADVRLMRRVVGPGLGIKASGGVRSAAVALELVAAGATRIGASASVQIIEELAARSSAKKGNRERRDSNDSNRHLTTKSRLSD